MLVTPEYVFKDVTHITPEWLAQKGIRALVLDIDNTLTADRSQELPEEVAGWLEAMRRVGVKLTIMVRIELVFLLIEEFRLCRFVFFAEKISGKLYKEIF